jgi:hypothetical protein
LAAVVAGRRPFNRRRQEALPALPYLLVTKVCCLPTKHPINEERIAKNHRQCNHRSPEREQQRLRG